MSSGTQVQPTPVGALPRCSAVDQGRREGTLCRHFHALVERPFGVLPEYVAGRLPTLPAGVLHPRADAVSAVRRWRGSWLQRADEVVTVGAVKVTHVTHLMARAALLSDATPSRVTSNFPHEIKGVTPVTQLSSDSLRARTRRTSDESYVTHVLSNLTSDASDATFDLSVSLRAYAPTVRLIKTHVTSVTGLGQTR